MSRSLKFTRMLAGHLRDPIVEPQHREHHRIVGRLDTHAVIVPIEIWIPSKFNMLKRNPPIAFCHAAWMTRTGAEWHNGPPLCWTIPQLWREAMSWRGKSVRSIMEQGREWFFADVRCLINRHYTAHCEGLTAWPSEWVYWGHGLNGVREYREERRRLSLSERPRRQTRRTPCLNASRETRDERI